MHTDTTAVDRRPNVFGGGISEISLGLCDQVLNAPIKIMMPFMVDTDFDGGRNLDGL